MDVEEEEKASPKDEPIHAPFPVATVKDAGLNLRAYLNTQGKPEWLWARVQEFLGIKSYGGSFLPIKQRTLTRGHGTAGGAKRPDALQTQRVWRHWVWTLERSYIGIQGLVESLGHLPEIQALEAWAKGQGLSNVPAAGHNIYAKAHSLGELPAFPHVAVTAPTGRLQMGYLTFNMQGLCESWGSLMHTMPAAESLWGKLTTKPWRGYQLSSSWAHPRMDDLLAFLLHLAASPKRDLVGKSCGKPWAKVCCLAWWCSLQAAWMPLPVPWPTCL